MLSMVVSVTGENDLEIFTQKEKGISQGPKKFRLFLSSASELVTEDGLSSTFIEYIEGTRSVLFLCIICFGYYSPTPPLNQDQP